LLLKMYAAIQRTLGEFEGATESLPAERMARLRGIAEWIRRQREQGREAHLVFICTHNSRRSQFAQVWAQVAAHKNGLNDVRAWSAGTEATAVAGPVIETLEAQGFRMDGAGDFDIEGNRIQTEYLVNFDDAVSPVHLYSKTIDEPDNPAGDFAAIMVCSDADENCPFVPGAAVRFSLPFEDPKVSDGTADEAKTYFERSKEIAREMMVVMKTAAG
jgi:arsenate reductase